MMAHKHRRFWLDLGAKIGAPMFVATLVACLLREEMRLIHVVLMGSGLALIYFGHRLEYHAD